MRTRARFAMVVASATFGLCLWQGCGSSPETQNPTPPKLDWNIRDLDTATSQDFSGNAETSIPEGHQVRILLKAAAPGGIKRISFDGEGEWNCSGDGVGENRDALLRHDQSTYTAAQAPTSTFLVRTTSFSGWECDSGFNNPTGRFTFTGEGENFASSTVKSRLTICNPRGC